MCSSDLNAILAGGYLILVHSQAGAATGLAQEESGFFEYLMYTFLTGLFLHLLASRHHPYFNKPPTISLFGRKQVAEPPAIVP